jgi:hypothetical protein
MWGIFSQAASSSFTMAGGSIEGNRASSTGGGVCFDGSSSFAMTGGSITGNSAAAGGGICANNTFSLSGNVTISGNSANVIGANLLLFSMEGAEPKVQISAALTSTTPVGVSILGADGEGKPVYAGGVFTTGNTATNSDYLAKFTSDSGDFAVRAAADSQLQLAKVSPSAPAAPGTPAVTVPVSSDAGKASVSATVTNGTASVSVTDSQLKAIVSDSTDTGTVKVDVSGLKDVTAASLPAKARGCRGKGQAAAPALRSAFRAAASRWTARLSSPSTPAIRWSSPWTRWPVKSSAIRREPAYLKMR